MATHLRCTSGGPGGRWRRAGRCCSVCSGPIRADPLCPPEFKAQARSLLPKVGGCYPGTTDQDLRKALLRFIADFANWDNAARETYLEVSRALVKAAHGEEAPLVVDPFAGGSSIPLVRSFWLCKKPNRKRALRVVVSGECGRHWLCRGLSPRGQERIVGRVE